MMKSQTQIAPSVLASPSPEDLAELMRQFTRSAQEWTRTYAVMQEELSRMRAEIEQKNELLKSQERLAALGQMAAGVAHEIRNPLGGIQLYANLLQRSLAARPADLAVVEKILAGVRHMERVVQRTLTFAGNLAPRRRSCDLGALVRVSLEEAGLTDGAVEVSMGIPAGLSFEADPDLLRQLFSNLFINARESMADPPGARPRRGRLAVSAAVRSGKVSIEVSDTGPGVPAELRTKLFDPFVTTKPSGVGLGLSVVWRIVEAHQGEIRLVQREGEGACFALSFPLAGGGGAS